MCSSSNHHVNVRYTRSAGGQVRWLNLLLARIASLDEEKLHKGTKLFVSCASPSSGPNSHPARRKRYSP